MLKPKRLFRSFIHAFSGFFYVLKKEQNFRVETLAAIFVIATMIVVGVEKWEAVILIMTIVSVLVLEVLNTCLERLIDILKPRIHPHAKILKDLMASAVFLVAMAAAVIGALIFWPYLFG